MLLLYAVTDRSWLMGTSLETAVEEAIKGGVTMVQLREKNLEDKEFILSAKRMKKVTDFYNIPLIINDNVSVALESEAAGVHIGQGDIPAELAREILGENKILGVSARTVEQAKKAEEDGADYLGVGAVFGTTTKKDATPLTLSLLYQINQSVHIPLVAIGGIQEKNICDLKGSGVSGIAVVSALFAKSDICKAAKSLIECEVRTGEKGTNNRGFRL